MTLLNTETSWGLPARLLHWATAAVILFLLAVGLYMANAKIDLYEQFALTQTHKSWGFVAFTLGLVRIAWRLVNRRTPEMPATMSAFERFGAKAGHLGLYALMIAMPVSGWLMASASPLQDSYGVKNMVFGLFELPDPFKPGSQALTDALLQVHFWCAMALIALIVVHAGAALRHHFMLRDPVLARMTVGR